MGTLQQDGFVTNQAFVIIIYRHPKAHKRPNFKEIVIELLGREDKLLKIPWEDRVSDRQAAWLGAPLRASRDLYPELQSKYTTIVKTWHM